jgi:hypothetical protein
MNTQSRKARDTKAVYRPRFADPIRQASPAAIERAWWSARAALDGAAWDPERRKVAMRWIRRYAPIASLACIEQAEHALDCSPSQAETLWGEECSEFMRQDVDDPAQRQAQLSFLFWIAQAAR